MNALKTGIHAESLVLPTENLAELDQLIEDYYQHHHPATPDTRALVDDLVYCEWMLRRLRVAESQAWQYQSDDKYRDPQKYPLGQSATNHSTTFTKLQYRLDATRRARLKALDALQKLQAAPTPVPDPAPEVEAAGPPSLNPSPQTASPQIGFVPATPFTAPHQPAPTAPSPSPNPPIPGVTGHARIR
jgi:hypothetical protein